MKRLYSFLRKNGLIKVALLKDEPKPSRTKEIDAHIRKCYQESVAMEPKKRQLFQMNLNDRENWILSHSQLLGPT